MLPLYAIYVPAYFTLLRFLSQQCNIARFQRLVDQGCFLAAMRLNRVQPFGDEIPICAAVIQQIFLVDFDSVCWPSVQFTDALASCTLVRPAFS